MTERIPIHDPENDQYLGTLVHDSIGWQAQTIFGYVILRSPDREAAERALYQQGLSCLEGVWQYYDKDEYEWFPCVIAEAQEHLVRVIRTTAIGYQDPEVYKMVIIKDPNEQTLIKSA